ncbi:hypothetical protein V1478_005189 [Vespula squamosa]|uniref:Branched-chain-amino-acid aminotransferase n=1 Tax=Vespula squamosa TaxID=30214 RepID=A0ABD2BDF7_VESSQ
MVYLRRKILLSGSALNQLQKSLRWSSSLKIRDKKEIRPERSFKYADLSVRLAAPHHLQPKPNVRSLSFGKYFTDHMLKIFFYETLGGWQTPEITPFENLVLHPGAKVLHYAIELFEGLKAYRGVDGKIRLFRPELNMERMNNSAIGSGLPSFNGNELIKCFTRLISIDQEWVPHSTAASLYIRPTLIGIDPTLGVSAPDSALLYVILCPVESYYNTSMENGVSLLADPQYTRSWPGGCGNCKVGSNYGPTIKMLKEALKKGYQQMLWLYGEHNEITEVGAMNIFMVYLNDDGEKELVTPPLNGLILPGVVRNSILALSQEWNQYKVSERKIYMKEICRLLSENRLLEMFGSGTACIISPISNIGFMDRDFHIPTMQQSDPIYKKLEKHLKDIQYGYISDHPWTITID